jgi:hypothetical protein
MEEALKILKRGITPAQFSTEYVSLDKLGGKQKLVNNIKTLLDLVELHQDNHGLQIHYAIQLYTCLGNNIGFLLSQPKLYDVVVAKYRDEIKPCLSRSARKLLAWVERPVETKNLRSRKVLVNY